MGGLKACMMAVARMAGFTTCFAQSQASRRGLKTLEASRRLMAVLDDDPVLALKAVACWT